MKDGPLPCEFRFLVICLHPEKENGMVTLQGVLSNIALPESWFPGDLKVFAVVGAVLREPIWGKVLDLRAWQLGHDGQRETLVGYRGTPLILPQEEGATCCPYPIAVPITCPGIYGFDLFDRDGVFIEKEGLLATYLYAVGAR